MMNLLHRIPLPLIFFVAMLLSVAAAQSSGDTELNLGVQAYKQAKYEEASWHFERAAAQEPGNVHAHLYLATVCAQQYIPGADTPDNNRFAERAIEQYKKVINLDSSRESTNMAVKGIAYLDLQMKRFDEAKADYQRAAELDPNDPEVYYSMAVIDWTLTYPPRMEERSRLKLTPDASLPAKDKQFCAEIREKNWANIADGIDNLNKALQLRPDYDDAMAYLNLMYRERADVQCDDPAAHYQDLKTADEWVDKTLATKKLKAEKVEDQPNAPPKQQQ
ncbi:MAG: tetratricopeptide repeat protein [Terriglobales bacterium]